MAIYNSDEFNEIKCPSCGHMVFYTKNTITLTKDTPGVRNSNVEGLEPSENDYIHKDMATLYYCNACDALVAEYDKNKKDNRYTFYK